MMIERLRALFGMAACAALFAGSAGCAALSGDEEGDDSTDREDGLRVCATGETVEGIDVSYYQETVDWDAVKQSGREFAFIRVSDGVNYADSRFQQNWAGAKDAGVLRGAYQFFRPAQSAETQADMMVSAVGALGPGDLPAVIDVETADGQSSATIVKKIRTWLQKVEAGTGRRPIIYAASGFWNTLSGTSEFSAYNLWVANYTTKCPSMPSTWSGWSFWQYSDSGSVPGVEGGVDVNRFNGTLDQLLAMAEMNDYAPMELGWQREASGVYDFHAIAPADVVRVEYLVENYLIGGATRDDGADFPIAYTFNYAKSMRFIEVRGYDAGERQVARGIGLIDSIPGTAVFIRQMGDALYEIGLERAPGEVAAIEVTADGYKLTDGVSGTAHSTRLAVKSKFTVLGQRNFSIDTFNADGSKRGTLTRTFTLE
ncbi:MAG: glycoside hydrolase family 25 protein [Polyangiaceae bacterium]|nr:glycoside hydrolase family 25 protein [Polyangiaceae bacterium]